MGAQNIQFRGIRRSPSDITGQDGDLLDCVNLVHEDGELKPIAMPGRSNIIVPTLGTKPYTLAHIHNTTDGDMFVYVYVANGESRIRIRNASNTDQLSPTPQVLRETVKWVKSVGNTLVIGTDKSIHYVLYKGFTDKYKWLGDSLPRPVIDFKLVFGDYLRDKDPTPSTRFRNETSLSVGMFLCTESYNPFQGISNTIWSYHNNGDHHTSSKSVRDNIVAKITQIVHNAKEKNEFVYPFVIRYAMRLYDGIYACQSQPILMLPSTTIPPIMATINAYERIWEGSEDEPVTVNYNDSSGLWEICCNIYIYGQPSRLQYYVKHFINADNATMSQEEVEEWGDVIKGVDIFFSSQIDQINEREIESDDAFVGKFRGAKLQYGQSQRPPSDALGYMYDRNKNSIIDKIFAEYGGGPGNLVSYLNIPQDKTDDYIEKISKTNIFYLAKSYKLNQYNKLVGGNGVYYDEEVEANTLASLESAKTLPDDYISRGRIKAETGRTYNKRLILGNINAELPNWYPILEQGGNGIQRDLQLYFEIEKNGKTIYVEAAQNKVSYYRFGHYIYYPDPDCKRVIVYTTPPVGGHDLYTIEMQEHENLNGAYAIMDDLVSLGEAMDNGDFENASERPTASSDRYYPMRNAIAMTEVANPFALQAINFKEAGNGSVIDLAPNMMEVSSGQWGQYPLYVFTTDGIYAFGINSDGTLGTTSPVSSDVLLTPKGMTMPSLIQTDQMLVFLTTRGVMSLQGAKVQPLSLVMDGRHFNAKDDLGIGVVYNSGAFASIMNEAYDTTPFHNFMLNGYLAYDYTHNNVLVLNQRSAYQYVLSLNSRLWSRQVVYSNLEQSQQGQVARDLGIGNRVAKMIDVVRMSAAVNNYTEMYLQGNDNHLYVTNDVTDENSTEALYQYGYFITRPVRFGTDDFKTITRLLHRYTHYAERSDVKLAIYGSRDGVGYHKLNTLRGMSWRYYIFVVYTYLKPNERYSYMTVGFEPRLTNKLR